MDDKPTENQGCVGYGGTAAFGDSFHNAHHTRSLILRLQTELESARSFGADQICDGAADFLGTLYYEVTRILSHPSGSEPLQKQVSRVLELIHLARTRLKDMRGELQPIAIDGNLAHTIENEVNRVSGRAQITPYLSVNDHNLKFSRHFETTLFRIAEQALSNVEKHAAASEIRACYGLSDCRDLLLDIRDDGKSIPPDKLHHPESVGLVRMRELARLIGGSTEILTVSGGGTRVFVTIPEAHWKKEYVSARHNDWLIRSTYDS